MKNIKNKKIEENKKYEKINCSCKPKIWKIIAIAVIAVFIIILTIGLIKVYHFKSSFSKPNQEQVDYAKQIATERLQSVGVNVSDFEISVPPRMRRMHDDKFAGNLIPVSFCNNATTHFYLVDVSSGEVIMHSETNIYKSLGDQNIPNPCHNEKFGPPMSNPRFFEGKKFENDDKKGFENKEGCNNKQFEGGKRDECVN